MIKTISPYYVYVPLVNPTSSVVCNSYLMNLYVWEGDKNAVPSEPTYTKTKINSAESNSSEKLNISRLVNDFIDFNCTPSSVTSLEDGNNQVWVKFECFYDDQPDLPQLVFTEVAVKGYGYFMEGENPDVPVNKILLEGDEFKVNRNGYFVLPIILDGPEAPEPILVIDSIDGAGLSFTTNIDYTEISYRYKDTEVLDWTIGENTGTESPFLVIFEIGEGTASLDVQIFTYDPLTDEVVYSPSYELILS